MSKVIAVANSKGGVGKSTTVLNLVRHLMPERVIDADNHLGISSALKRGDCDVDCVAVRTADELVSALDVGGNGLVIVDCGGFDTQLTRNAIFHSDFLLVPTSDDFYDLSALGRFSKYLESVNDRRETKICANVLLNRVHHSRSDFSVIDETLIQLRMFKRLPIVIPSSVKISDAAFSGDGVKTGHLAAKYFSLSKLILEKINE